MSPSFLTGNAWLAASILLASTGQVCLRAALREGDRLPAISRVALGEAPLGRVLLFGVAAAGIVAGFVAWAFCLRHLAVSYAYTVACSSVVLVSVLGCLLLRERWSVSMSLGAALILCGTILLFADGLRANSAGPPDSPPLTAVEAGP